MLLVSGGGGALNTGWWFLKILLQEYIGYSICLQNQNTCIEAGEEAKKTGRWKLESAKI